MPVVTREKEIIRQVALPDGTVEKEITPVEVYVHCYNHACTSYHNLQENLNFERKVPGIRETTEYSYKDRGGDMPGVENSHVAWYPQDPADATCPDCGERLNVSEQASRKIQSWGVGPGTGLKGAERAAALAASQATAHNDDKVAALEKQVTNLTKLLEKTLKQTATKEQQ